MWWSVQYRHEISCFFSTEVTEPVEVIDIDCDGLKELHVEVCSDFQQVESALRKDGYATLSLPLSTIVGTLLYIVGMSIEAVSETQRANFKKRPANADKVFKEGMWSWSRHIDYFGYSLWRGGYCMVATSWIGDIAMGLWQG
ncbi:hypothetical protein F5Y16DRAFT_406779 [Xylariaceae sp. FL0255]|nr:hypothetical protein F5Y16DRAFT_406779 [Xylariaceae sp. FL0255]